MWQEQTGGQQTGEHQTGEQHTGGQHAGGQTGTGQPTLAQEAGVAEEMTQQNTSSSAVESPQQLDQQLGNELAQSLNGFNERLTELIEHPTLDNAVKTFGPPAVSLGQALFGLIVLVVVVSFVGRWLERLVRVTLSKARLEPTVTQFLSKTARYALWIVAVPIAFEIFGVKTTSLAAVIGAAGLAIGLAMQGSLSNIAAGVMLLLLRPFRLGDWVKLLDEYGEIEDIGIFYTRLNTFENHMVILPNSQILSSKIENVTESATVRVYVPIGVAYGSDLKKAQEALLKAATGDYPGKTREQDAEVLLLGFGDSSINFEVRAWCMSRDYRHARTGLCSNINNELKAAGLEIPFPQRDLHIRDSVKLNVVQSPGE